MSGCRCEFTLVLERVDDQHSLETSRTSGALSLFVPFSFVPEEIEVWVEKKCDCVRFKVELELELLVSPGLTWSTSLVVHVDTLTGTVLRLTSAPPDWTATVSCEIKTLGDRLTSYLTLWNITSPFISHHPLLLLLFSRLWLTVQREEMDLMAHPSLKCITEPRADKRSQSDGAVHTNIWSCCVY